MSFNFDNSSKMSLNFGNARSVLSNQPPKFRSSGNSPSLSQASSSQKSTKNDKNRTFTFGMSESPTFTFSNMADSKLPSQQKSTSNDNVDKSFTLLQYLPYFFASASLSVIICILPSFLGLRTTKGSNKEMSDDVISKLGKKNRPNENKV